MSDLIQVHRQNRGLVVRFARPELRNPLSVSVLMELEALFNTLNEETEKIVFTGTGDVFASGADLREIANVEGSDAKQFARRGQALMDRISKLDQITVAAIGGFCFGGALDLALACDRRIASPNAKLAQGLASGSLPAGAAPSVCRA